MPLPPAAELREQWGLEPGLRYLNHGAFGGVPRVVREAATALRAQCDANPTGFLTSTYWSLLHDARQRVAAFIGADPAGLVFVPNATAGVATVLAGLGLGPEDEVVTTDHCYGAVRVALAQGAARVRVATVPVDAATEQQVVQAVLAAFTDTTKALVIDHVASPTGFAFPVAALVSAAHDHGVAVCVDAAHALAMLDVDVTALGADYWVGNLHKWLCGPRAAAVVVAAPSRREQLRPLVPSHLYDLGLHLAFDWTGTYDPAPVLAAPVAIDWLTSLGWDEVRRRQVSLAVDGALAVAAGLGTRAPLRSPFRSALGIAELPRPLSFDEARTVENRLRAEHRVEVPITGDGRWVRVSGAIYNEPADYLALAEALPSVLPA